MKIKKLVALVIILIAVAAIAVIYFSLQKSDDNSIEIKTIPFDKYLYNSPIDYGYTTFPGSPETTFDTIFQNINLRNGGENNFYSLFVQEDVGKEVNTNRLVYTDSLLMEKLGVANPDFYVLETKVENGKIIRKLESTYDSSIHTIELADFWILEKGSDPKVVISLLISSTDSEACEIDMQELDSQAGGSISGKFQYQILFKPENLSIEKLNNYKNISADNFCGKYGPKKSDAGYMDNGVFLYNNNVLIYADANSPWRWLLTYDTTKIIHR